MTSVLDLQERPSWYQLIVVGIHLTLLFVVLHRSHPGTGCIEEFTRGNGLTPSK